ncbi:hypothetical protein BD410DRAFT_783293 [Rickenella mellea]|uniref:Uncharacterized protein n=1 Tax=Rickenella mellea TaxID=50990 RepID=A0A4Y7QI40_9AGAM|nr:hypothetical protein BD410DRAFT_783293 [Rickenella mellea]
MIPEKIEISLCLSGRTKRSAKTTDFEVVKTNRAVTYLRSRLNSEKQNDLDTFASALLHLFFPNDGMYPRKFSKLVVQFVFANGLDNEDTAILFYYLEHDYVHWKKLHKNHTIIRLYAERTDINRIMPENDGSNTSQGIVWKPHGGCPRPYTQMHGGAV